jgi:hypothetical protein
MIAAFAAEAVRGVAIALCIALVIAMASIGCDLSRQTRLESHSVKGIHAAELSRLSRN